MNNPTIIGDATFYLGDCIEIMSNIDKVDLVLTDPPYGILGGSKSIGGSKSTRGSNIVNVKEYDFSWDNQRINKKTIDILRNISKEQIFWGWNHYSNLLPPTKSIIVWDKKCKNYWNDTFSDCELAWSSKGKCTAFRYLWMGALKQGGNKKYGHPTEKPVELMLFCLNIFPKQNIVFDPFMGSGSTAMACYLTNRKFIGIEKEKKYFNIAVERYRNETKQLRLYDLKS
jgi:site-specific DNA-methyltransferase (adenine-specific)/modification methylase